LRQNAVLLARSYHLKSGGDRALDLFDPKIGIPLTHPSQIREVFSTLKSMTDIVTDWHLNTRIWTKQAARSVEACA
jgi:hypothetical protein